MRRPSKAALPPLLTDLRDATGVTIEVVRAAHEIQIQHDILFKARVGITVRQFGALVELARKPDAGSGQLARILMITPQSAGPLLTRLEAMGMVKRRRTPGQRMQVILTAKAVDHIRRGTKVIAEMMMTDQARLPSQELAALEHLLRKFSNSVLSEGWTTVAEHGA